MEFINDFTQEIQTHADTILSYLKFLGILAFGILLLSSLFHFVFGKKAQLNHAVSASVEILCLYVINIVIYSLGLHWELFLSPLPFISIEGDYMYVMPIHSTDFHLICEQVLKVVMIAFLVNLLESIMPKGKKLLSWYFFRLVTVVLAVGANYLLEMLISAFVPNTVFAMAETVLLCLLIALILLGSLKLLVGATLAFLDPIVSALYTFFFSSIIGRQLAKALVTTALITALVALLDALELTTIFIAASGLTAYIPLLLILLVLWYIIGHIL